MKKNLVTIILICIPILTFSQNNRHQTEIKIDKRGNKIKRTTSNFGLQTGFGFSRISYDSETQKYFGIDKSSTYFLSFFYSNFLLRFSFKPIRGALSEPTDTLHFVKDTEPLAGSLNFFRTDVQIGYTLDLPYNFGIEPTLGYLSTSFEAKDENGDDMNSISKKVRGFTLGFSINKYFKLRSIGDYLVVYINNNINFSNYSSYNPDLGNSFYSIEMGFAVKGWFLNKTKLE